MNIIRPVSSDEMIGEFLRSELHSSRFRAGSLKALSILGYSQDLLDHPDYNDSRQNEQRAQVLGLCRGWPDKELFSLFPKDTDWYLGGISQDELAKAYRLKSNPSMSPRERLLSVTAAELKSGRAVKNIDTELIKELVLKIEKGIAMPPIILVAENMGRKKVLIEGHSRGTAYVFVDNKYLLHNIPAIIGVSANMPKWAYY